MSLQRRTPLVRTSGLRRGSGLMRRTPLAPAAGRQKGGRSPRGSVAAAVRLVLAEHVSVAEAAARTGADPEAVVTRAWETVKEQVRERDSHTCLNCGKPGNDVHHRVRRGMGGTADPSIAFGMANLVLLCRPDHQLVHGPDNPLMTAKGYRLLTCEDPAMVPVLLFGEGGGALVWLTAEGGYALAPPESAGAR